MAILDLEIAWPDEKVPRLHPCQAAGIGPHQERCGATPASLWLRSCVNGHERERWLCGSHAALATRGHVMCTECAEREAVSAATLAPLTMLLAR